MARITTKELPSLAALATVLPLDLICRAIEEMGVGAQRVRKLPPEVVTWLIVGMGLFRNLSVANVLRRIMECLGDSLNWRLAELPHTTSMTQARDRLGWETARLIFQKLADLLVTKHASTHLWFGLPVYAMDGTSFLTADSDANDQCFGRPGASRGRSGFPQLRAVVLMGAWTHLVAQVVFGPWSMGETKLAAKYLLERLQANTLILMDRAYFAFGWLVDVDTRGTYFVVRVKTGSRALKLKRLKKLGSGEHTAHLLCPPYLKRERPQLPDVLLVRIVTYQRKGYRPVTVVTNLLDRERFPAKAVGALYHDRWEIELGYRELKIHLGEERVIFRSHTPERVLQEAYGLLIAYNCVRALMAEAAAEIGIEPRFLSFMDCLERIRWAVRDMARADPRELPALHAELVGDLALCRLPPRRSNRRCERAVKIKMSNFARKRRGERAATSRNLQAKAAARVTR